MRVIMAAIIHRASRKFNADEAEGVSRRHTRFGISSVTGTAGSLGQPVESLPAAHAVVGEDLDQRPPLATAGVRDPRPLVLQADGPSPDSLERRTYPSAVTGPASTRAATGAAGRWPRPPGR
jgi:hypothetical protein